MGSSEPVSPEREMMRVSYILPVSLSLTALQGAPQANFGERNKNSNSSQEVDNKIFFGNSNLNNILLGAAVGAGGAFLTQEIINSQNNNQCNCAPARRRRQLQHQQEDNSGDKKIFGLLGGGNCNCPPASVEYGADCKGRPEGNPYYGCGCQGNAAGGIFTFGRRKRQININSPTSTDPRQEDVNNRFFNFRCIDAALTGRNQDKQQQQSGRGGVGLTRN